MPEPIKNNAKGKILEVEQIGIRGGEAWLLIAERSAILVDSSFPFYGQSMAKKLRERLDRLGEISLSAILITHSHYDHAGGFAKVKGAFPEAIVVASRHAEKILKRDGALKTMRALNKTAAGMAGGDYFALDDDVGGYVVDIAAGEGDRIYAEEFLIEVWETPGHTNDSLSFWLPEERLLVLSETTGVFLKGAELYAESAFIVSWKAALANVERIEKVMPDTLLVPHAGLLSGDDIPLFLTKQREEIIFVRDLVFRFTAEGKTEEDILSVIRSRYYDRRPAILRDCQPLAAFMVNFKAMIPRTLKERP